MTIKCCWFTGSYYFIFPKESAIQESPGFIEKDNLKRNQILESEHSKFVGIKKKYDWAWLNKVYRNLEKDTCLPMDPLVASCKKPSWYFLAFWVNCVVYRTCHSTFKKKNKQTNVNQMKNKVNQNETKLINLLSTINSNTCGNWPVLLGFEFS